MGGKVAEMCNRLTWHPGMTREERKALEEQNMKAWKERQERICSTCGHELGWHEEPRDTYWLPPMKCVEGDCTCGQFQGPTDGQRWL
jgi:hypothetical protein